MTIPGKTAEIKRYRRAKFWDYRKGASLFITISVERSSTVSTERGSTISTERSSTVSTERGSTVSTERGSTGCAGHCASGCAARSQFGYIIGGRMVLNELGRIVAEALDSIAAYNPGVTVYGRVVMPDHVHFNVSLAPGLDEPLKILGRAIARFKNFTIKQSKLLAEREAAQAAVPSEDGRAVLGQSAVLGLRWQQGYHDRLCLSRAFIDSTERYIAYNPLKWQLMYQMPGALAIHEPLDSLRLDSAEYWKGVGNVALLSPDEKIVSLRISRRLSPAQVDAAVKRMGKAIDAGYIILSGFVSPGEKLVRDMLCARKDARFIRILPSSLPNRRFKPESRYVDAFAENRYLEIARGNEEIEFSRAACLDYNAEIIEIANAGEGMALYFRPEGVIRLGTAQPSSLGTAQPSARVIS